MIDYATFCQLRSLLDQKHMNQAQVASELKLDPKTVAHWAPLTRYQQRQNSKRSSKLDSFKGQIVALLESHPFSAQQILQKIKIQGYGGGYSILKEFVQQVRPVRKPAFLMLEFGPGECAQADWGTFGSIPVGSTRRRLSFFVMVLCYSRLMYVEFTLGEAMDQFLGCHRRALEFFGGVPSKIMIDNLKTGVLEHPLGEAARFNPRYLDFAAHYGFAPVACQVKKANEKGRVENGVGYVKKNFLEGLNPHAFEAVNPAARQWLDTVANVRVHGETRVKPLERFASEKTSLKPLPPVGYDCALIRPISANSCCRITFQANRYTVPYIYASKRLTLKVYGDKLLLFHNEKNIATHIRSYDRRQDIKNQDHIQELINQRDKARAQTSLQAFLCLGPQAEIYAQTLRDKRINASHHIQKIVALSQLYSADKVAQALSDAIKYDAYGCEYITNILEQRERMLSPSSPLHLTHRQDLLDLDLPPADLTPYEPKPHNPAT